MRVIIDTNIWISFLIGHKTHLMTQILTDLRFEVYVCSQLIAEIKDVAGRSKISKYLKPNDLNDLLEVINAYCLFTNITTEAPSSSIRDPKDLYLLSLAKTIEADYIVSGDADLKDIGRFNNTKIITLTDFKQLL